MIYIFGISITFFLSAILLTKKRKSEADTILGIWLGVIGLNVTLFYLVTSEQYFQIPYFLGFEIPMPLLHGPFLFLYTYYLTQPKAFTKVKLLNFIPFLIGLFVLAPFLRLSTEEKIAVYLQEGNDYATISTIIFVCIIISGVAYSALSLGMLRRHHKRIRETHSYEEKINLKWLYYLVFGLGLIWVLVISADDQYIFSAVVVYVLLIGFYGIKQVGIFSNQVSNGDLAEPEPYSIPEIVQSEKFKYEKSGLTSSQLNGIHENLTRTMDREKLYLTPELTLADVADKLSIHPNVLSQVINQMEGKNFFDYINGLRVEDFMQRITRSESHKFTMLSLAMDCGFNSKTSFNRNFKKATGMSPSDYLKTLAVNVI
jgi:AraC-like DNA-binding protein